MASELGRPVSSVRFAFERFLAMGALPCAAEPVWERMFLDIVPRVDDQLAYLVLHREVVYDDDDDPEGMGWTLRLDVDVRPARVEGRPAPMSADAEDAPELSLDEFARAAGGLLDEQGVFDIAPARADAF